MPLSAMVASPRNRPDSPTCSSARRAYRRDRDLALTFSAGPGISTLSLVNFKMPSGHEISECLQELQ